MEGDVVGGFHEVRGKGDERLKGTEQNAKSIKVCTIWFSVFLLR